MYILAGLGGLPAGHSWFRRLLATSLDGHAGRPADLPVKCQLSQQENTMQHNKQHFCHATPLIVSKNGLLLEKLHCFENGKHCHASERYN